MAAPERPPALERTDETGAIAAAEYFLDLFRYVMATGDTTEWDTVSATDCGFCENVRADAAEIYENGNRLVGGDFALEPGALAGFDDVLLVHAVEFRYTSAAGQVVDSSGGPVRDIAAGEGYLVLDVGRTPQGWLLVSGGRHDESVL